MTIAQTQQSDNLIFVKEMTATEVARNFSAVLDAVEAGEEIVILRGKVEIARLSPTGKHVPNGAAIVEWYRARRTAGKLLGQVDPDFAEDMAVVLKDRDRELEEMSEPWQK